MAKRSAYLQRREAELDATFNAGAAMAMQFAMDTLQMALHQTEGWGYDRIMRITQAWLETQREYKPALNCSVIYRFGKIKTETGLDARKFWDLVMLLEMEES